MDSEKINVAVIVNYPNKVEDLNIYLCIARFVHVCLYIFKFKSMMTVKFFTVCVIFVLMQ
jgi:hypothetical protein